MVRSSFFPLLWPQYLFLELLFIFCLYFGLLTPSLRLYVFNLFSYIVGERLATIKVEVCFQKVLYHPTKGGRHLSFRVHAPCSNKSEVQKGQEALKKPCMCKNSGLLSLPLERNTGLLFYFSRSKDLKGLGGLRRCLSG